MFVVVVAVVNVVVIVVCVCVSVSCGCVPVGVVIVVGVVVDVVVAVGGDGGGVFAVADALAVVVVVAVVGFVGVVLQIVQLPVEAALALFMAIDHICEGPRSLLSLMMACVLIVIVSEGLPSERLEAQLKSDSVSGANVQLSFTLNSLLLAFGCFILMVLLIILLGIGVGMR